MYFPDRPNCSTEDLRRDVRDTVEKLGRAPIVATIGTSATAIAHGLGEVPTIVSVLPHADANVWRAVAADKKFIYLQASTAVECTIRIAVA